MKDSEADDPGGTDDERVVSGETLGVAVAAQQLKDYSVTALKLPDP